MGFYWAKQRREREPDLLLRTTAYWILCVMTGMAAGLNTFFLGRGDPVGSVASFLILIAIGATATVAGLVIEHR